MSGKPGVNNKMKPINKTYTVNLGDRRRAAVPKNVPEKPIAAGGDFLRWLRTGQLLIFVPREPSVPMLQIRFTEEMAKAGMSIAGLLERLAARPVK